MQQDPLLLLQPTALPPIHLAPATPLELHIRYPGGSPVANTWVFAESGSPEIWAEYARDGWRPATRVEFTDEEGRVTFLAAPGEVLEVTVFAPGTLGVTRRVSASGVIQVPRDDGRRRWIGVVDPAGSPVPEVLVRAGELAWPMGLSDGEGRVALPVSAGPLKLWLLTAEGQRQEEVLAPATGDSQEPVVFTLSEPVRFAGRVIDAVSRQPIAGAFVWPGYEPANLVRTDAQGRYQLLAPGTRPFWYQAEAPGYLPVAHRVRESRPGTNTAPTLALTPAAAARGRVVDGEGRPVAGVEVVALEASGLRRRSYFRLDRAVSRATSDEEGRFHLPRLAPKEGFSIEASAAGFSTGRTEVAGLQPGQVRTGLTIVLEPSRAAHGWVVDPQDRPVAGAEVLLRPAEEARSQGWQGGGEEGWVQVTTDEGGRFEVADVPRPRVDLRVTREGFAPAEVRSVAVPPGREPAALGTVVLLPGAVLAGRVTDRAGEPLADAGVLLGKRLDRPDTVLFTAAQRHPPLATTDADGSFRIPDLPAGRRFDVIADAPGYLPAVQRAVAVPPAEPVALTLAPAAAVAGRVIDEEGSPIAGAEVSFEAVYRAPPEGEEPTAARLDLHGRAGTSAEAETDEVGTFTLEELRPGPGEVYASAKGFQPAEAVPVRVPERGTAEEVEIVLVRGETLAGTVRTTEGEPVPDTRVLAASALAISDADGAYRLTGLPPGAQTVEARHPDYGWLEEEVEISEGSDNRLDLTFEAGHEVRGRVVDRDGAGVEGALLTLSNEVGRWREHRALSDPEGRFVLSPVADGEFALTAEREGFAAVHRPQRVKVAGESVEGLEVLLPRGGSIAGRILGLDFEDLARVEVSVRQGELSAHGRVDYEGAYGVAHLAPGDWEVTAALPGGNRQAVERVMLAADDEEVVRDLEFGAAYTLSGVVLHGEEVLPGVGVSLRGLDVAAERSVTTDHTGSFAIDDVEAGRYRLQVSSAALRFTHSEDLDLYGDRELAVRIATARVSGRVVDAAAGVPVAEAVVALRQISAPSDGQGEAAFLIALGTEADGSFYIPRVTPGLYRLTARKDGYAAREELLTIAPEEHRDDLYLALEPTAGLDLAVSLAEGGRPPYVSIGLLDGAGRTVSFESRELDQSGIAHFQSVPPGEWRVLVSAPNGGNVELAATVPGEPVPVVLPPAARLAVRVPELVPVDEIAHLSLLRPDGRPFLGVSGRDGVLERWPVVGGSASVEALPPGAWTLQVTGPRGETWAGQVAVAGGSLVPVTCTAGQCFVEAAP